MIITGINVSNGVTLKSQFRAPEPPTIGVANVLSNNSVNISFTGPVLNGDSAIIGYTALSFPDNIKNEILDPNASNITITGLNDNTNYTFSVTANNSDGPSANSSSSNLILTDSYPPAPTISYVEITSSTSANIVYTAPAYNGNSTITSYTAVSNVGNVSATVSTANSGNITITGLANNITHGFSVYAVNQYGRGISSNLTNGFFIHPTVYSAPNSPTISYAETRDGVSANIVYTAPAINGNSEIISYTATSIPGNVRATVNTANSGNISLGGLTRNTDYTFVVTATNAFGTSSNSNISNSITTLTVPNAPIMAAWSQLSGTANISYIAPSFTGSTPITSYTLVSVPENRTTTVLTANSGSILMPGLTIGTTYVFAVYATNNIGSSILSEFSNYIKATTNPGAPSISYVKSGDIIGQANIVYTAPVFDGGDSIISYTANANGIVYSTVTRTTSGNITVTGLTTNVNYEFTVVATNVSGNSLPSTAVYHTLTAPTPIATQLLLIAGGGGGSGGGYNDCNGGGGAGGLLYYGTETPKPPNGSNVQLLKGSNYAVTIGSGGTGFANGSNSLIVGQSVNLIAIGGGRGGNQSYTPSISGDGGSSGGSAGNGSGGNYGSNVDGQGYRGGAGDTYAAGGNAVGGGGGGAGGNGVDGGYYGSGGGNGGPGLAYSISGSSVGYAGGGTSAGAGAANQASSGGGTINVNGTTNTGGGSGAGTGFWGGVITNNTGGSGVAVIRYADSEPAATLTTGSPNVTVAGGWRTYRFWQSGSITL